MVLEFWVLNVINFWRRFGCLDSFCLLVSGTLWLKNKKVVVHYHHQEASCDLIILISFSYVSEVGTFDNCCCCCSFRSSRRTKKFIISLIRRVYVCPCSSEKKVQDPSFFWSRISQDWRIVKSKTKKFNPLASWTKVGCWENQKSI